MTSEFPHLVCVSEPSPNMHVALLSQRGTVFRAMLQLQTKILLPAMRAGK